jgi:hypothetical protein
MVADAPDGAIEKPVRSVISLRMTRYEFRAPVSLKAARIGKQLEHPLISVASGPHEVGAQYSIQSTLPLCLPTFGSAQTAAQTRESAQNSTRAFTHLA